MARKRKPQNRRTFLIHKLRRATFSWRPRKEAEDAARRELPPKLKKDGTPGKKPQVRHMCAKCDILCKSGEYVMDHIDPVIPVKGFDDWNGVIPRMLPYKEGWQCLCHRCHDEKTAFEDKQREKYKNRKKT